MQDRPMVIDTGSRKYRILTQDSFYTRLQVRSDKRWQDLLTYSDGCVQVEELPALIDRAIRIVK